MEASPNLSTLSYLLSYALDLISPRASTSFAIESAVDNCFLDVDVNPTAERDLVVLLEVDECMMIGSRLAYHSRCL
jgi:hypothetical protein